jgi:hypothetical protein
MCDLTGGLQIGQHSDLILGMFVRPGAKESGFRCDDQCGGVGCSASKMSSSLTYAPYESRRCQEARLFRCERRFQPGLKAF